MKFLITGFSQFSGVEANPTQWIVEHLEDHLKARGSPAKECVEKLGILPVSAKRTEEWMAKALFNCMHRDQHDLRIVINLGVNIEGTCFHLESKAYNCANFRVPDVDGWQPKMEIIENREGLTTDSSRDCLLPLSEIARSLRSKGHEVKVSDDPGRYVCNWTYYHSLMVQDEQTANTLEGRLPDTPWRSLFVHVPSFDIVPCDQQLTFITDLLESLRWLKL